jgi:predicted enzyme related to lactoylglutathione lyase
MARITGIGGVFIRSKGTGAELTKWYADVLGLSLEAWGGAVLRWPQDTAEDKGATVWNPVESSSEWFPGPFMINYRVDDMAGIIAQLAAHNVPIHKGPEYAENGVFLWIHDPDGNRVELWEPKLWDDANKK